MTMAERIVAYARECVETPFRHQARLPGIAIDCAGVICHVMDRLGLPYQEMQGYPRQPYAGMLEQVLDSQPHLVRIAREEMMPGDVLLMRFKGDPQHLAILSDGMIIHAYADAGKCCEHDFTGPWPGRVVRVYRIVGEP